MKKLDISKLTVPTGIFNTSGKAGVLFKDYLKSALKYLNVGYTDSCCNETFVAEGQTSGGGGGSGGSGTIVTAKVSLTSAEILQLNTTPKVLVPAQGAGTFIQPICVFIKLTWNTTPYATNTSLRIAEGINFDPFVSITSVLPASGGDHYMRQFCGQTLSATNPVPPINIPLTMYVPSGNPTAGDSSFDVYITYEVITL